MKKILIVGIAFLALIGAIAIEGMTISRLKGEKEMYHKDIEILTSDIDTFRTRNNELAAKVQSLELTKKDFERLFEEDARRIRQLKTRNEELEHLVSTHTEAEIRIETIVRDSIVYRDKPDTIKVIRWENAPWDKVTAEVIGNKAWMDIEHHDELDIAIFMDWKKFLWWKTKLRGVDVDVVSKNPYTASIEVNSITIR